MTSEIRPLAFSDSKIQQAIDAELEKVPADRNAAVLAVAHADEIRARLAVMFRLDGGWSFGGYLDKPYAGELTYGAQLRFSR